MDNIPFIQPGKQNDPSVKVGQGTSPCVTEQFREVMTLLGFSETAEGAFVYNSGGRAIWINPSSPTISSDVTDQIIAQGEAIGRRSKINELRKSLDLPFGEVEAVQPSPSKPIP